MSLPTATRIYDVTLRLLQQRGAGKSICPSEVARALDADAWRELMDAVRDEAAAMAQRGEITIPQGDAVLDPAALRGPLRLRLPPAT